MPPNLISAWAKILAANPHQPLELTPSELEALRAVFRVALPGDFFDQAKAAAHHRATHPQPGEVAYPHGRN